jgi:hypothetical protein
MSFHDERVILTTAAGRLPEHDEQRDHDGRRDHQQLEIVDVGVPRNVRFVGGQ